MLVERVDREADDLHAAAVEVGLDLRHVAELGRADRGEVLRVREQDDPRVADPVVEADRPLCRLGLKVGRSIAELQCHSLVLLIGGANARIGNEMYDAAAIPYKRITSRSKAIKRRPPAQRDGEASRCLAARRATALS